MKSQRLLFEHYCESDFDVYFPLVNNAEVMKMILGRPLLEYEARMRFKDMLELNQANSKMGHYKVSDKFVDSVMFSLLLEEYKNQTG